MAPVSAHQACDTAIVVDWGFSRSISNQATAEITKGSPAYASPEQLTGYSPEQVMRDEAQRSVTEC